MNREKLKFSECNSSAKTFALQMTWIDAILSLLLVGAAAGSVHVWGGEASVLHRVMLAALASVSAYSSFVLVRALVPFVLHLSFAHMMCLRLPFYIWIVSLLGVTGLCGASELFSTLSFNAVQLTLILASIMLTVRFFQSGSLLRLVLAFSCAGGAVGISIIGILAPAAILFLMWSMANRILVASNFTCWDDKPHPGVVEYFANPLVRSRVKWMFIGSFLLCAGFAFRLVMRDANDHFNAMHAWLGCIGLDGAAFLLMTAILPLVVGIGKAGVLSEVIERYDACGLNVYMAIAPFTALVMLKPDLVPSLVELDLHVEPHVLALASVVYVFNLLLAGMIILSDFRCRDFRGVNGVRAVNLRNVMRFSYAMVTVAPLVMYCYAVFLRLK